MCEMGCWRVSRSDGFLCFIGLGRRTVNFLVIVSDSCRLNSILIVRLIFLLVPFSGEILRTLTHVLASKLVVGESSW